MIAVGAAGCAKEPPDEAERMSLKDSWANGTTVTHHADQQPVKTAYAPPPPPPPMVPRVRSAPGRARSPPGSAPPTLALSPPKVVPPPPVSKPVSPAPVPAPPKPLAESDLADAHALRGRSRLRRGAARHDR